MTKETNTTAAPTNGPTNLDGERGTVTNLGEAVSVLVQGVQIAQAKGIYTFDDAAKIHSALTLINDLNSQSNSGDVVREEVDASVEK